MAVLDFFKKQPSNSGGSSDSAQNQTPQGGQDSQTQQTSQTVTSSETQTTGITGGSYNGIGNPPSGQSYNGIGNPPAPAAPQTTTTTTSSVQQPPVAAQPTPATQSAAAPGQATTGMAPANPAQPADTTQPNDSDVKQADPSQSEEKQTDPNAPKTDGQTGEENKEGMTADKMTQLDLMTHLTQRSNRVFMTAQQKATELKSEFIDSEHILHGLLADPEIYKIFTENKVQPNIIEEELEKIYKKGEKDVQPQPSPRAKRILDNALVVARKLGYEFISPEHILLALFQEGEGAGARILAKLGIKEEELNKKITGKKEGVNADGKEVGGGEASQSVLSQYTRDLTAQAESGQLDPVVERSATIERTIHIISRRTKNNPVLVGEAGVGKTAVVEGLAQAIASKNVPEPLIGKRILQLDLMAILAGASHRGDFEERMKKIIEEITASDGKIILFIDEIHNIVGAGAGGGGSLDASNFLKPSLARGELQMIGATTLTEYRKYVEKDPALERRFQPVLVPEPDTEAAIKMLKALRDKYEAFHRVKIPDDAVEDAVKLSKRYVGDRFLPDKAIDLIDEAASAVRLPLISLPEEIKSTEERMKQIKQEFEEAEKRGDKVRAKILQPKLDNLEAELKEKQEEYNTKKSQTTSSVTPQSIKDIIARWTGIPISKISESETEKLTNLEDIIHERLINQNHAVEPVAQAVRRGRAGLKSTERPIGSFVFLGPTGVGKTELSKTLAEVLFGQEEAMIRFDMTEYMEKHEVAKLLGAPPGYVGYEEGGKLTEAVRRRPYSVVLFDEIEKAHPDIFNIMLQILDDGRLTDNKGHVISFKNTVVICTSNIGTKMIQDEILADGKVQIEEPTALTTYTFSPRGRQIMTIMGKVFERESEGEPWSNMMLIDYFAGQKVQELKIIEDENGNKVENTVESDIQFPGKAFDTHAMSPQGTEIITVNDKVYTRTSTTAKEWNAMTLIDYFKDNVVINALPDAPEQQLPTVKLKTHAFSPAEEELVTYTNRYWKKKGSENNWQTGELKDYFEGHTLENNAEKPAATDTPKETISTGPETPPAQVEKKEEGIKTDKDKKPATFPTNYWDIQGFTAEGNEFIVVGENIWVRAAQGTSWKMQTLHEYFGDQFPLDKELEEKQKIEEELAKNQYGKIKAKVMTELGKFFRPELINRFDEVIIFEPLKYRHMIQIAELQLKAVRKLLEEQNIGFDWTDSAKKEIVRQGFDPIFGARPLKRTIQKLVENPVSTLIIEKKLDESDMVVIDFDGDKFLFNIEHVSFVPRKKDAKILKKFKCLKDSQTFETEIAPNSTVICPMDGTKDVQEVKDNGDSQKKDAETPKKDDESKSDQNLPKQDDKNKPMPNQERNEKDARTNQSGILNNQAMPKSSNEAIKPNGNMNGNPMNGMQSQPGQAQKSEQATAPSGAQPQPGN